MIPPGVISGTEIFTSGENLLALHQGHLYTWPDFPESILNAVGKYLEEKDIKAYQALEHLEESERLYQYMSCRFGSYDATPDICDKGVVTPDKKACSCSSCPLAGIHKNVAELTTREVDVVKLIAADLPVKLIADRLCVSIDTVKTHRSNIYRKTGNHSNVALTRWAIENDIS